MNKTLAIIQARMGSTRLPGKVLKELAGKPVLYHIFNRIKACKQVTEVIIATSDLPQDDQIAKFCINNNFECFRASEADVLERFYLAAKHYQAESVVRITGDCPLIDPEIVDLVITNFFKDNYDYYSNAQPIRSYPKGLDTEIFSFEALVKAYQQSKDPYEREHVTPYFYKHPELFKLGILKHEQDLSELRWVLDTQKDYEFISKVYEQLYREKKVFGMKEILSIKTVNG